MFQHRGWRPEPRAASPNLDSIPPMKLTLSPARFGALSGLTAALLATLSQTAPALAEVQSGGRFTMEASVIASGGSQARGGRFTIEATIGQLATGPSATVTPSNRFQLESGFWTPITVQQTPGAPELKIQLLPGGLVRLSWPIEATGFALEGCSDLALGQWEPVPLRPAQTATENAVTVQASGAMRCYRLKK